MNRRVGYPGLCVAVIAAAIAMEVYCVLVLAPQAVQQLRVSWLQHFNNYCAKPALFLCVGSLCACQINVRLPRWGRWAVVVPCVVVLLFYAAAAFSYWNGYFMGVSLIRLTVVYAVKLPQLFALVGFPLGAALEK